MFVVPALLGIGCAAALWVAARSNDVDAQLLAVELIAIWAIANMLWLIDGLVYLPALDWIVGVQALVIASVRDEKWVRIFVALIVLRLTLHVVDYLTAHAVLVSYIHGLNATFALLIVTVIYAGSGHVRDTLLGHLHRLGAGLRSAFRQTPRLVR